MDLRLFKGQEGEVKPKQQQPGFEFGKNFGDRLSKLSKYFQLTDAFTGVIPEEFFFWVEHLQNSFKNW